MKKNQDVVAGEVSGAHLYESLVNKRDTRRDVDFQKSNKFDFGPGKEMINRFTVAAVFNINMQGMLLIVANDIRLWDILKYHLSAMRTELDFEAAHA